MGQQELGFSRPVSERASGGVSPGCRPDHALLWEQPLRVLDMYCGDARQVDGSHDRKWRGVVRALLEYRDLLASTQDPAVKAQVRDFKRRDGQVMAKRGGGIVYGPYKLEVRKELLRRLLQTQKQIRANGPNPHEQLISPEELQQIRRLWRSEAQDWEDSVPRIYREVTGEDLEWIADEQPAFSGEDRRLLEAICERHDVPASMVAKLVDLERELHGMSRRASVHQRIAAVVEEDWRSEDEVLAAESEPAS